MTPQESTSHVVFQGLEAGLRMFRWVVVILLVLFLFSGLQRIEPDSVGLLLRFGELQGATPGDQVKQPGLLPALPYPIDQVLEVPGRDREGDVVIDEVWKEHTEAATTDTIDPVLEGYCLTGDNNIVQAKVVVKYKITDPVAFELWTNNAEREVILRDVVLAALTQTVAGWKIDDVLLQQRADARAEGATEGLAQTVWDRAQMRLDGMGGPNGSPGCGMTISALEFQELDPPRHVIADFQRVQSAKITMETLKRQAEGFAAREIPRAEAERNKLIKEATGYEEELIAGANAEASEFKQLYGEYKKNPTLVRRRLYQGTMERILSRVGEKHFVSSETRVILERSGEDGP